MWMALLVTALVMGCSSRKKDELRAEKRSSAIVAAEAAPGSPWKMALEMEPAQPKFAQKTVFHLKVSDQAGVPVAEAQVAASLVMPLMDMGTNEVAFSPAGRGAYQGTGSFTMAGEWEVIVTATSGGRSGKYTFNVRVEE